ncbi:MAG: hypothetical protein K8R57_01520 [Verrucomicrobia bacterium]|nr:hypothetical protein [Verrucomicrobiota bacterium]
MKGKPLLRLAIVLLVLAAVLWPVCRLTLHRATPQAVMPIASSTETHTSSTPDASDLLNLGKRPTLRATLLLHAAPSPQHCLITQAGRKLLTEKDQISRGEYRTASEITKGEDLLISADWGDEEPHALRLEVLVHGYQAPLEKSFWGQKTVEDTLSIPESFLP